MLSGEFPNALRNARASSEPCNYRIKHAEGLGECAVGVLTDNLGEAHVTDEPVKASRVPVREERCNTFSF